MLGEDTDYRLLVFNLVVRNFEILDVWEVVLEGVLKVIWCVFVFFVIALDLFVRRYFFVN